jgi:hypothetical protein
MPIININRTTKQKISIGKDMEQLEPGCIAGGM